VSKECRKQCIFSS